ncbi:hypothetical protein EUTSA_v10010926mg [Eutrema salsugineum]|uniref:S-protein homolog n=1 Tax=Eutrema salsugineum TaxID=72664 RepID=V4LQV1_EUTSA|nr:S-protein homolog 3 [Eutrema salsugineum]ESQ44882.1 hypothetical protein EUTSA_v10010926mg [Eutrema salsugineum]
MALSNDPHCILMFMISLFTLVLFASALDIVSINDVAEAPTSAGSGGHDGFLPLAGKHVVIHNVVENGETVNVHCKSSEDDLGLIHIPWNHTWGFRFHVNFWKTTRFRCHFTWGYGGGSHYFDIFKVSRDDTPSGSTPVCKECIWEVGSYSTSLKPMCRINRDGSLPYCFDWDDK